jgi:hypothetical protein
MKSLPSHTIDIPFGDRVVQMNVCTICARRWGRAMPAGACICTGHASLSFDNPWKKTPMPNTDRTKEFMNPETKAYVPACIGQLTDPKRSRLTAKQAASVINCLVDSKAPTKLVLVRIHSIEGLYQRGIHSNSFVRVDAKKEGAADHELYSMWFFLWNEGLTNCFLLVTPKGAEYNMDLDGGSPWDHFKMAKELSALLSLELDIGLEWVCRVVKNPGNSKKTPDLPDYNIKGVTFPVSLKGKPLFESSEAAKLAIAEYRAYMVRCREQSKGGKLPDEKKD